MKNKSITLIILVLTFLSIFTINIHFINNIDRRLDQLDFFKAGFKLERVNEKNEGSQCNPSADSLPGSLSEDFSLFIITNNLSLLALKPITIQ